MSEVEIDKICKMYWDGKTDVEIAEVLFYHKRTIANVRHMLGLLRKSGKRPFGLEEKVKELFDMGYGDVRIASELNVPYSYVEDARQRLGLYRKVGIPRAISEEALRMMVAGGATDVEIARRFDCKPKTIGYWRIKYGLGYKRKQEPPCKEVMEEYIKQGFTQEKQANLLGISVCTVRKWQRKYGLKQPSINVEKSWDNWRRLNDMCYKQNNSRRCAREQRAI